MTVQIFLNIRIAQLVQRPGYGLKNRRLNPRQGGETFLQNIQPDLEAQHASCSVGIGSSIAGGKAERA